MKRLACLLLLAPLTARAGGRSYNGETSIKHDCAAEPEVSLNTGDATAVFTGTCDKIAINGGNNTITIASVKTISINGSTNTVALEAADKIAVTGSDNKVTYKKAVSGAKPKVATLGRGNKVTRIK